MIKVSDIFECISGNSGLTEEFIYNNLNRENREYKVLSSSTKVETSLGYVGVCKLKGSNINIFENQQGILVVRKGKAGKMIYLPEGKYTTNDDAYILKLKLKFVEEFKLNDRLKQQLFLKYFQYIYQHEVYEFSTKSDNSTWNKTKFFQNCSIEMISIENMEKVVKLYEQCNIYREYINKLLDKLNNVMDKAISLDLKGGYNQVPLNSILKYVSRNDSLSEEGIYNFYPKTDKTIDVLSGSISNIYYGKIDYYTPKIHKLENKQAIHIVTRGKAGKLTYIKKGIYATNTNAFLLYIDNDKWKELKITNELEEEYYLKFLMIYLQPYFYEVCSNSDVSVFPLTETLKNYMIPKFIYGDEIKKNIIIYNKSQQIKEYLNDSIQRIETLIGKEIVIEQ